MAAKERNSRKARPDAADDGGWLAFSIMHNGFRGSSAPYKKAQDDVCRLLTRYRKSGS